MPRRDVAPPGAELPDDVQAGGAQAADRSSVTRDGAGGSSTSSASRTSQPPGNGSTSQAPSDGIHVRPGTPLSGSRIRLCGGSESTAATQPSESTASAGLPTRARIGAATVRSRLSVRSCYLAQLGLRQPGDQVDQRDGGGMHRRRRARHVDDADDLAGARILDRGARTRPRVMAAQEVLGGEHLDGPVRRQRGADGVGADGASRPTAHPRRSPAGRRCRAPAATRTATAPGPAHRRPPGCCRPRRSPSPAPATRRRARRSSPEACRNASRPLVSTSGGQWCSGSMPLPSSLFHESAITSRGRAGARLPAMVAS